MIPAIDSLRRKIVFGYAAAALLMLGLSSFAVLDMRRMEEQITAGEHVTHFLNIALEIRRFEKNYFLYRERADFDENRAYADEARRLLDKHATQLEGFARPEAIRAARRGLDDYVALMAALGAARPGLAGDADDEARIREAGKAIVTYAEEWWRTKHALQQEQLARHRHQLIAAIAIVAILLVVLGQWLARRVTRPLKRLEESMAAVAAGRLARIEHDESSREIASLTTAFNHVLRELDLRQGQLVRAEKLAALGTLLSGVAHELNNPLSNISTSCEILKEEAKVGAGRTAFEREMLDQIDAETWRARRIVRSLLDYARDRDFRREEVPLAALVEESLRLVRARIPARVDVAVTIPPDLTLACDKQRLQQALFNLIGNAIDALADAGHLSIAARRAAAPLPAGTLVFGPRTGDDDTIEIEVKDDGAGIPADVLPRIFDPFFTTKDVGRGLGLGLFIVFEIVAEHGGCIAVQSAPGAGTTFFLRFPDKEPQ